MLKYSLYLFLLIISIQIFSGCSNVRTEFYRAETQHLYIKGTELYKQGNYQDAKTAFEEVVDLDPDYGPAHAALGNLAMIREEYPEAKAHYLSAIQYDQELEEELRPLFVTSTVHTARQPLVKARVDLNMIHTLLMDEKFTELEELLKKDFSLQLLATDSISLTPGKLGELRLKAVDLAPTITGSIRLRLFLAHLLFTSQKHDSVTIGLLNQIVQEAGKKEQQEIYVLLGRLHERTEELNQAVNDYLAAVNAGMPMAEVAPFIARIYKVDIATVMVSEDKQPEPVEPKLPEPNSSGSFSIIQTSPDHKTIPPTAKNH